mgnify:CR=1 FL=1
MRQLAHRLDRLGTETAFSVAQAAAAWKAKGNHVYPFHLGDINIPTAPHIIEAMDRAIADGYTGYCPGPGIPQLREALAEDLGSRRGIGLSPENIVVVAGGPPRSAVLGEVVPRPLGVAAPGGGRGVCPIRHGRVRVDERRMIGAHAFAAFSRLHRCPHVGQ